MWSTEHLNTEGAVKLLAWKKATAEGRLRVGGVAGIASLEEVILGHCRGLSSLAIKCLLSHAKDFSLNLLLRFFHISSNHRRAIDVFKNVSFSAKKM